MPMDVKFDHIRTDRPVVGFTGALGSGCTFLAKGLSEFHRYYYCSLSKPIHDALKAKGLEPNSKNLQDMGDKMREENGADHLVMVALSEAEKELSQETATERPAGLIVDGIRNTAEVQALRAWPHFYLVSVQAKRDVRETRVLAQGDRCKTEEEFRKADERDAEEQKANGQQVTKCNYLADISVINEKEISTDAKLDRQNYIHEKLYQPYLMLIERMAMGEQPKEARARRDEALMTLAYVESRRSSCVKRQVGAVIATEDGDVISAGYNDVPEASTPCIYDPRYRWCARDHLQESIAQKIACCPSCGSKVEIKVSCQQCAREITNFVKRCPHCKADIDIDYQCPKCQTRVFEEFLAGASEERTGKLLDMCRALHAEENAILNLSRTGVRLPEKAVLYSTTFPCNLCANKIVAVGIRTVVYAEPYTMKEAELVFEKKHVALRRFEGVKSNAYFRLYSR
jgi:deoxycytidylate deaminase/dephospho-CoA kinase